MSDDKPEVKHALANGARLFDDFIRTDSGIMGRNETLFDFLNRSSWASVETARKTLEIWFAWFPEEKRGDIRGRFQGVDRQHLGALLEIVTHEVLCAIGTCVQVDPDFDGKRPDFAVTYQGAKTVVECTVVQESDNDIKATNMENTIKKVVDSIDTGKFALSWILLSAGDSQPSIKKLVSTINYWVSSLDLEEEMARSRQGYGPSEKVISFGNGWNVRLGAIPVGFGNLREDDNRAIGLEGVGRAFRGDDGSLKKAIKKKASAYQIPNSPYLIVVGSGIVIADFNDLFKALLGREVLRMIIGAYGAEPQAEITHKFDGLFGSPSTPHNRHVSAVLFKPGLGNVWTVCGKDHPWQLVHNPWTKAPLPTGMFTFATEWILEPDGLAKIESTSTLNSVLGLPDPWPGWER